MKTYVFSKKAAALRTAFPQKDVEFPAPAALAKHSPGPEDLQYLDLSGFTAADGKKAAGQLKKRCKNAPWGIIDPKGTVKDPAQWFFDGAADYIGPAALKEGLAARRLREAAAWRQAAGKTGESPAAKPDAKVTRPDEKAAKRGIKLPAGAFPAWQNIAAGENIQAYLLYASLQGKTAISTRLGEAAYEQLYRKLLTFLRGHFQSAEGLLWMETGKDCLFLVPPKAKCVEMAIVSCLRILISAPQIAIETLNLSIPVNFVFGLHYGSVTYKPPGKTGTVVSDAVNFIFHLGTKQAEPGRLTVSDEVPDPTISSRLEDLFVKAGEFEGRQLVHTRKFSYLQPWL
jgi:class 3 adenylate cyclase